VRDLVTDIRETQTEPMYQACLQKGTVRWRISCHGKTINLDTLLAQSLRKDRQRLRNRRKKRARFRRRKRGLV
jgi:hypothetical protein